MNWYKTASQLRFEDFRFIPGPHFNPQTEEIVITDIAKFDLYWSRDEFYISPKEMIFYYPYYLDLFQDPSQREVIMPKVIVDTDGQIGILDGRHRYAAIRDLGVKKIPMIVPKSLIQEFRKLFAV